MNHRQPRAPAATALRALAVGGVLLAAGVLGFLAHRLTRPRDTLTPAPLAALGASAAPGQSQTAPGESVSPAARPIPEGLPEIALPGIDGVTHRLSEWKGKPLLINFWATWCEPCRREIPLLLSLRRKHAGEGLQVLGIAIDSPEAVRKYAAERRIDYPLLIGEQGGLAAASAFGMDTVLPFSVFADERGRVITVRVGELHPEDAELILSRVHEVDTGVLTPAAARDQISQGVTRLNLARGTAGSQGRGGADQIRPDPRNSPQ